MLSKKSKARRRQLSNVNIKVTFIAWFVEFLALFAVAVIPPIFFGQSRDAHVALQILTHLFYFVLMPFSYLINSPDTKNAIVDTNWFHAIRGIFNRTNIQVLAK